MADRSPLPDAERGSTTDAPRCHACRTRRPAGLAGVRMGPPCRAGGKVTSRQNLVLARAHGALLLWRRMVMPDQVQHAMDDQVRQFVPDVAPMFGRLAIGGLDRDNHLAQLVPSLG